MTRGYLSGINDEIAKASIENYAAEKGLGNVSFIIDDRPVADWKDLNLVKQLRYCSTDDCIIIHDMTELVMSVSQLTQLITFCHEGGIKLCFIVQNLVFDGSEDERMDIIIRTFELASEIEKTYISKQTKARLQVSSQSGTKLGRPKSMGSMILDEKRDEVIDLYTHGSTKVWISRHYGVPASVLQYWLKCNLGKDDV